MTERTGYLTLTLDDYASDANGGISGHLNRSKSPPSEALLAKFRCSICMILSSDTEKLRRDCTSWRVISYSWPADWSPRSHGQADGFVPKIPPKTKISKS